MKPSLIHLATDNGKRVGRTSKAKRLAASPATEAARLRRSIACIKAEAEASLVVAKDFETLLNAVFRVACGDDPVITRAMVREACISVPTYRLHSVVRSCEMAEEGTLCA